MQFRATLEAGGEGDAWVLIRVPFNVEKVFGSKGRVSVTAKMGGQTYPTSIFPSGDGTHHLMVNKAMQKALNMGVGSEVDVDLTLDKGTAVEIPEDLAKELKAHPAAERLFASLTAAAKREFAAWIQSAKRPETRAQRVAKSREMILAGKRRPSEK